MRRWIARQGDVLVERTDETIPSNVAAVKPERGRCVLARGEATGHAHTVSADDAVRFGSSDDAFWLRVDRPTRLIHEEHTAIALDPGTHRVRRQREYSPSEIRRVAD